MVAVNLYFETRVYSETKSEICARISPIFPIFAWDSEMGLRVEASAYIENLRPNGKLFFDLRREVWPKFTSADTPKSEVYKRRGRKKPP